MCQSFSEENTPSAAAAGEEDVGENDANPLVVNMENRDYRTRRRMQMWFNKVRCGLYYALKYCKSTNFH